MLGEGYGSQKKNSQVTKGARGQNNRTKRDADDDKRASMTMNERELISHTPLYGISRGFAETSRSACRNICRVRAKYVLSTRKMGRGYGTRSPGGVYIRRMFKMFLVYY